MPLDISTTPPIRTNTTSTDRIALRIESDSPNSRLIQPLAAPVPDSAPFELKADLVLLAMGFTGPERTGLLEQFGVQMTDRGTVARDANWMTSVPAVFTAGDMQRGQSLIVWAIADGRSCARGVDVFLTGQSDLPAPVA